VTLSKLIKTLVAEIAEKPAIKTSSSRPKRKSSGKHREARMNIAKARRLLASDAPEESSGPSVGEIHKSIISNIEKNGRGSKVPLFHYKDHSTSNPHKILKGTILAEGHQAQNHDFMEKKGFKPMPSNNKRGTTTFRYAHPNGVRVNHTVKPHPTDSHKLLSVIKTFRKS
jgi:hypothetical protein